MTSLLQRAHPLSEAPHQRQRLEQVPLRLQFAAALAGSGLHPLRATSIETLQINLGKLCNQTCRHLKVGMMTLAHAIGFSM